jgi:hypothetical protein
MSFYEGSILTLKITGANLDPTWNILLCPSGSKSAAQPIVAALNATSTKIALSATVDAPPGSAGSYSVYFEDSTIASSSIVARKWSSILPTTQSINHA